MSDPASDRVRLRRLPKRGAYDRETITAILDAGMVCHVAFADGPQPFVLPMAYVRVEDEVHLHGSSANRCLRALRNGAHACLSVTLLDGLVLARSAAHHSMNFRSVVLLGQAREVRERGEKLHSLKRLVEHVVPGRWDDARQPSERELVTTLVVAFPIDEASAKIRSGPPVDEEADYELAVWAGTIPLETKAGQPIADPRLPASIELPEYLRRFRAR